MSRDRSMCPECGSVQYQLKQGKPEFGRTLTALSDAIEFVHCANRELPSLGQSGGPAGRMRSDVQYHLQQAGFALGKAYDALRTLSKAEEAR